MLNDLGLTLALTGEMLGRMARGIRKLTPRERRQEAKSPTAEDQAETLADLTEAADGTNRECLGIQS